MTRDPHRREGLDAADQTFLSHIADHGWNVTKVFTNADKPGPDFAYSTGLFHSYEHPEILIFGLPLDTMHKVVNNISIEVKKGATFESGVEYDEFFAGCGCCFRTVGPRHYPDYLGWAIWFYQRDPFPCLQCFWPDKQGKYPWEEGCAESVRSAQPILSE
jgi:hypothetical protein